MAPTAETRRAYDAEYRQRPEVKARERERHLLRAYGISEEVYQEMLAAQGGGCAICGADNKRLHVDHDHETGKVRGILCHSCNQGLGKFRDNPALLQEASVYLGG